jgi:hypothetical protein
MVIIIKILKTFLSFIILFILCLFIFTLLGGVLFCVFGLSFGDPEEAAQKINFIINKTTTCCSFSVVLFGDFNFIIFY